MSILSDTGTVIAIGGGKGGVGKSFIASNIACAFARTGSSVVLIDADLAGANIHILFGIIYPDRTLSDFLKKKVPSFNDILLPTSLPNLRLICGASDLLEIANPHYAQKQRLLHEISRLNADMIIIDVGAGANLNNLDFFNAADTGIIVTTPSPTALQNAYGFLKMAVHRKVLGCFTGKAELKDRIHEAFGNADSLKNIRDIIAHVSQIDPEAASAANDRLVQSRYHLIVNTATAAEGERVAKALCGVAYQYLDIDLSLLGAIGYDATVENSIRKMEPIAYANETQLSGIFVQMANRLTRCWAADPETTVGEHHPTRVPRLESSSRVQLCLHDETMWRGTKLHVQTEDLGLERAQIVSLVFSGGRILHSRKYDYHESVDHADIQNTVAGKVKQLHRAVLQEIAGGLLGTITRQSEQERKMP